MGAAKGRKLRVLVAAIALLVIAFLASPAAAIPDVPGLVAPAPDAGELVAAIAPSGPSPGLHEDQVTARGPPDPRLQLLPDRPFPASRFRLLAAFPGAANPRPDLPSYPKTRVWGSSLLESPLDRLDLDLSLRSSWACEEWCWSIASAGRNVTADPLGYVDGPSMYQYAGNSPFNYSDPMGLARVITSEHREQYRQNQLTREALRDTLDDIPLVGGALAWIADGMVSDYLPASHEDEFAAVESQLMGLGAPLAVVTGPVRKAAGRGGRRAARDVSREVAEDLAEADSFYRRWTRVEDLGAEGTPHLRDASRPGGMTGGSDAPVHHIGTNKNWKSARGGGPWSPRFEAVFSRAGMTLEDGLNKIEVPGHRGPHPPEYHQAVLDRLVEATRGLDGAAYRRALEDELQALALDVSAPGTLLNLLVTGG